MADVIIRLFEDVSRYMEKNGVLIASGIIDIRSEDVEKAAAAHGFSVKEHLVREQWHAYVLYRA